MLTEKTDTVELESEDDTVYNIWQLSSDNAAFHFVGNYEPAEQGWILEHFIDKFYFQFMENIPISYIFARKIAEEIL